jgi:hypothetical protein
MHIFLGEQTLNHFLASNSGPFILLVYALVLGSLGVLVAWVGRLALGGLIAGASDRLPEAVQNSMLGFTAFTLALALSNVHANLHKATDAVIQEASALRTMHQAITLLDRPESALLHRHLRAYVEHVAGAEWTALGAYPPALAPAAEAALLATWATLRAMETGPDAPARVDPLLPLLNSRLQQVAESRSQRLQLAHSAIAGVFWPVMAVLLLFAAMLQARHRHHLNDQVLVFLQLAAFGLIVGLINILDQPFRGAMRVTPLPIMQALR